MALSSGFCWHHLSSTPRSPPHLGVGSPVVGCPAASPHPVKSTPSIQDKNEPPFSRGRGMRTLRQEEWAWGRAGPEGALALLTFRGDRGEGRAMEQQSLESWEPPGLLGS